MSVFTTVVNTFPVAPTIQSVTQSPGASSAEGVLSYAYPRAGADEGFAYTLWCKDKPHFRFHYQILTNPDTFSINIATACDYVVVLVAISDSQLVKTAHYVFTSSQPSG